MPPNDRWATPAKQLLLMSPNDVRRLEMQKIQLGDLVKDVISGFYGTATARVEYLNGCVPYAVAPKCDKEGKYMEPMYFDEQRIEVLRKKKNLFEQLKNGGPNRSVSGRPVDVPGTTYKG
jgi:hypothetical protein